MATAPTSNMDVKKRNRANTLCQIRTCALIRAVEVPEMQVLLKQGLGRAIRTETDTCVVAILDE